MNNRENISFIERIKEHLNKDKKEGDIMSKTYTLSGNPEDLRNILKSKFGLTDQDIDMKL